MKSFGEVYKGKTGLVTGHTGFKGSWLSIWLRELGAKVIGYALDPLTTSDNFVVTHLQEKMVDIRGDIRDREKLRQVFETYQPEIVFHLAAQAIVRQSYEEPVATYETNVMGTINVLECMRTTPHTKVAIMVTTDKCYENKEQLWGYRENDALGGYDPYSSSKAAAELAIQTWRESFMATKDYAKHKKAIASVRAGNVIGSGDFAEDRILPDCIRALRKGEAIQIRNPKAIRPWEHVLEALNGYLMLGEKLVEDPTSYSESWNFGPYLQSIVNVWEVASLVAGYYGKGELIDSSDGTAVHEAKLLNLDISKAVFKLGWQPVWSLQEAIYYTVEGYKKMTEEDPYGVCVKHIERFEVDKNKAKT